MHGLHNMLQDLGSDLKRDIAVSVCLCVCVSHLEHLGASWGHLGANLLHVSSKKRPRRAQDPFKTHPKRNRRRLSSVKAMGVNKLLRPSCLT